MRHRFNQLIWNIFGLDLRSLALFRIGLALLLLLELKRRVGSLREHYTDEGAVPRAALRHLSVSRKGVFSVHSLTGSIEGQSALFALHALAATALLVGYQTRRATALSWVLLLSLQNRNPLVLQADDNIRRHLLYWSLFLPLGARYSLDSTLRAPDLPLPHTVCSMGTVALMMQVCMIYWFSGLLKTDAIWRRDGTGIYYSLRLDSYVTPLGKALLRFPKPLSLLSHTIVPFELFVPFLLFVPIGLPFFRMLAVAAFAAFHLALGFSFHLALFPLTCIVAWFPFLPGALWDASPQTSNRMTLPVPPLAEMLNHLPTLRPLLRPDSTPLQLSRAAQMSAAFSLLFMLWWNLRLWNLERFQPAFGHLLSGVGYLFRFDQNWGMFSPAPNRNDGWWVMEGTLKDGTMVDLLREGAPIDWQRPPRFSSLFKSHHWRQLLLALAYGRYGQVRPYYADYLWRQWNRTHPESQHLQSLRMVFVVQETKADFQFSDPVRLVLWDHTRQQPSKPEAIGINLAFDDLQRLSQTYQQRTFHITD